MAKFILGIDGGGTHSRAVLVDGDGQFLGMGTSGSANHHDIGPEAVQEHLAEAVAAAVIMAGCQTAPFDAVYLGFGGVQSEKDYATIRRVAQNLNLASPQRIGVTNDTVIALAGGLSGRPGMVQIAGTGANTYGQNAAGETWHSGGWGHLLSDEGSGYWFGIEAMKAAVKGFDHRGPQTPLIEVVRQALGMGSMNDVMYRVYVEGLSRAEIAGMAPLIFAAAKGGDPVASKIIEQGAAELAMSIETVARTLGLDRGICEVAVVGGLVEAGGAFLDPLSSAVHQRLPHCVVRLPELPPALGACLLGLQLSGRTIDPPVLHNLGLAARQLLVTRLQSN